MRIITRRLGLGPLFTTRLLSSKSDEIKLTAKGLYKFLHRRCEKLPTKDTQLYYKHFVRQSYKQHADETDPIRSQQIISQAIKDSDWVLKKFKVAEK